ncbi:MAG: radical SAM protein, partial [Verrucomicrobia bacterium]|nr:radical SAM protein [Verrucomicrobiota bacterium]
MSESYKYLFGPVPSRRLGRSLGVDLIPFKTCTMDCTYCQLGGTTCETGERGDYVPMRDVLAELERWKAVDGKADHITLAGSGEPTLHTGFGEVLRWVKNNTDIPSVLLTNGSLLHLPEVRIAAALADKVKVTLSAWDEASFRQIHRPVQDVTFDLLIEGERVFRGEYTGELSVEVFIVDGVNSDIPNVRKIAAIAETLNPDRIDLNTAVRPPADSGVHAATPEQLDELAKLFDPKAMVVASFKTK